MYIRSKEESVRRKRNGLVSHILLHRGGLPDVSLTGPGRTLSRGRGGGSTITLRSRST